MKPLSDADLSNIYDKVIKPNLFNTISSSTDKTCIFLGGQPGAGKSYLNDISINSLSNKSAVVIDSDLIRRHHPYTPLIPEKDIYSLDKDCYRWGEMLIADSIKANKNIVFDGTFGGSIEHSQGLMERFKTEGYTTKLSVLATNDVVSKIGFNWRYEHQKSLTGVARPVDLSYHNQIYERIPENLTKTLPLNLIDEFNVYGRNHVNKQIELRESFSSHELVNNPSIAINAYQNERIRPFTPGELKELNNWFTKTALLVKENNGDLNAFKSCIQTQDLKATHELKEQIKIITDQQYFTHKVYPAFKKEFATISGRVGQDPVFDKSKNGSDVAAFSIQTKNAKDETIWQGVQVWKDKIQKNNIPALKKNDLVELKGFYGQEYTGKKGELKKDFIAQECIKLNQKQEIKPSRGIKM